MPALSAQTIARLREIPVRIAFPDTCEVVRSVSPGKDDFGNDLPATPTTVASSPCLLREVAGRGEEERVIADRLGWEVPFAIDLPYETSATPADTIRLANQNRTFHVGAIAKSGAWGITTTAVVEERG